MDIIEHSSPNFDQRPEGAEINMLVIHYTGMKMADEALARLCDPAARVSSHYFISPSLYQWELVCLIFGFLVGRIFFE